MFTWIAFFSHRLVACLIGLACCWPVQADLLTPVTPMAPNAAVQLGAGVKAAPLWSAWRMLPDAAHALTIDQALARRAQFKPLTQPHANLGIQQGTVWLRAPVVLPAGAPPDWWLSIEFFPLDEVEVFVVARGRVVQRAMLSQLQPFNQKPAPTHQHAVRLALQPGEPQELVLRVRKYAPLAMLLPASLVSTPELIARESSFQFWQSLMFAMGVALAGYALVSAVLNRERLYLWFAVFAISNTMSWFSYFGLASQHFWPDSGGLNSNVSLFFALLLPMSGFLFVDRALDLPKAHPWISQGMRLFSALLLGVAVLFALGVVGDGVAGAMVGLIGPWPFLLILPLALRRALKRDPMAMWTLAGWVPHAVALGLGVGLHQGHLPWSEWDNIVPQVGAALDLLAWTMVMSLRTKSLRRDAQLHREQRDRALVDAQTDSLTGLLNRRGLDEGLQRLLAKAAARRQMLALYVIDLDGFKPINDLYGHDAGDEALVMLAQRLRQAVRAGDLVCRVGGDEFVVVAGALPSEAQAALVGDKLLACCEQPFALRSVTRSLGMTVGYAISPADAASADELLKQADAAMYRGKQAGKRQVRRA